MAAYRMRHAAGQRIGNGWVRMQIGDDTGSVRPSVPGGPLELLRHLAATLVACSDFSLQRLPRQRFSPLGEGGQTQFALRTHTTKQQPSASSHHQPDRTASNTTLDIGVYR